MLKFVEKPVMELPLPECLGVYILRHDVLSRISDAMDHANSATRATREAGDGSGDGSGSSRDATVRTQINLSHDILQGLSEEGAISAFDIGDAQWVDVESPAILERKKDAILEILSEMTRARPGDRRPVAVPVLRVWHHAPVCRPVCVTCCCRSTLPSIRRRLRPGRLVGGQGRGRAPCHA